MSVNTIALATLSLGIDEKGFGGIDYPLEHAIVYYLTHNDVNFNYSFTWPFIYPKKEMNGEGWIKELPYDFIEYTHSMDLAEDIELLNSRGILSIKHLSSLKIVPGPIALKRKEDFITRFNEVGGVDYKKFTELIESSLNYPKKLLDECYKLYINEICGNK